MPERSPGASRLLQAGPAAALCFVVALIYRAWLARGYYGAEEEDWGFLGLIFGTLQSGFRYVEMEHMPLYTTLSAAASWLLGGTYEGGLAVALLSGAFTAGLVAWVGWRWFSPAAGLVAGLLLVFQPDSALYAATTLRISTYTALVLLGIVLAGHRSFLSAGLVFSLGFLCRFDLLFSLGPLLVLLALWETMGPPPAQSASRQSGRAWLAVGFLTGTAILWSAYYEAHVGTYRFWGDVLARNTTDYAHLGLLGRLGHGLDTLRGVTTGILPSHLGHAVLPLAVVGLAVAARGRAACPGAARWWAVCAVAGATFFSLTVALSAYQWDHNLYWKWMCPVIPLVLLLAAHGAVELIRRVQLLIQGPAGQLLTTCVGAGLLAATLLVWHHETQRQLNRSNLWYGTQVRFIEWVEDAFPPDVGLLARDDLIPSTYAARRVHAMRFFSWADDSLPHRDPAAFGQWLVDQRVSLVLWFREDWVGATEAAPFLSGGLWAVDAGPVRLEPIAREEGYGFAAYAVRGSVRLPGPSTLPPADAGGTGSKAAEQAPAKFRP